MKNVFKWFKNLFKKDYGKINKLGWKRDLPDPRDHKFKVTAPIELPPKVDLREKCPPIYDQGQIGSCTANAMGGVFQFEQIKENQKDFIPSRLFIYYNTRALEGTINSDAGATLRNTLKTMVDIGSCPETMWGYNKCFKKKPSNDCYITAADYQVLEYLRVTHAERDIKQCLAEGYPIAFGMMLYESFMSDNVTRTGVIPIPDFATESALGGHAVMLVGYDDSTNMYIVRNSWGKNWGDKGYFYLPYQYVHYPNLTADYWTIKLVESPEIQVYREIIKFL